MLRDRYGRTYVQVREAEHQAGYPTDDPDSTFVDCADPECSDLQLSNDGLFWSHSHPRKEPV